MRSSSTWTPIETAEYAVRSAESEVELAADRKFAAECALAEAQMLARLHLAAINAELDGA